MTKILSYNLFLHWKQGDDLAKHLEEKKTVSSALRAWADDFDRCRKACEEIAKNLDGIDVNVVADTHYIAFTSNNKSAGQVLRRLSEKGLLQKHEEQID